MPLQKLFNPIVFNGTVLDFFLLHSLEDDTFYTDTCNLFQNIELQVSG